jgi:hypothetical protein
MKRTNQSSSQLGGFTSGASLGGTVSNYRKKQSVYKQGMPAYTLFYIQEGGVCLTTQSTHQPSAVTAILGVGDFLVNSALRAIPFACPRPLR